MKQRIEVGVEIKGLNWSLIAGVLVAALNNLDAESAGKGVGALAVQLERREKLLATLQQVQIANTRGAGVYLYD